MCLNQMHILEIAHLQEFFKKELTEIEMNIIMDDHDEGYREGRIDELIAIAMAFNQLEEFNDIKRNIKSNI